jgi:Tol biopolymer transport system component
MRHSFRVREAMGCAIRAIALVALVLALAPAAGATRLEQVTYTGRDENWSSFAPDGVNILLSSGEVICGNGEWFCGSQNIWRITYESGHGVLSSLLLLEEAYHPRVSPDGDWVAGMVHNGKDWDVYLWSNLNLGGGVPFQSGMGTDERFPNWSSDSRYIAFDSNRAGAAGTSGYQIYYAPVESPSDPVAAVQATFVGSNNKHPTWSHDDREIAYVGDAQDRRSLSAVRLDGNGYRLITPEASQNRHPDWSPDGRWLAFTTDRWDGIGDIAIVRADGTGEVIRISENMPGHDDFPEWSHDSQKILFCGTAFTPPYRPNKEIFIASQLPTDTGVAVQAKGMGFLKKSFGGQ